MFKVLEILLFERGPSSLPEGPGRPRLAVWIRCERGGGEEYLRVSPFARSCHSTSLGNTIKATTTTTTAAFRLASFKYSELIPFALFVPTLFALPSCILIIPLPRLLNSVGFSIPGRGKREISASSYSFCFLRRVNRSFPSIYFRDPARGARGVHSRPRI